MKRSTKKSICLRLLLCLLCLCMSLPVLFSCSKPPELSEISDRFRELVTASAEINTIFFGDGLPTYERVNDPRETTSVFENEETGELFHYYEYEDDTYGKIIAYGLFVDQDKKIFKDPETDVKYFYRYIYDEVYGKIVEVDSLGIDGKLFIQLVKAPKEGVDPYYVNEAKGEWGYLLSDFTFDDSNRYERFTYLRLTDAPEEGQEAFYADPAKKIYCYLLPDSYKEPIFESYYTQDSPEDYDYVTLGAKYHSIAEIKAAAETVYSKAYLESIYDMMFVGAAAADESVVGSDARYKEFQDEFGSISLTKSNTYDPLVKETRLYLFDTAEIIEPSNGEFVTIAVDSYLASKPNEILNVKVTMVLQDGVWMLDGPTY